MNLTESIELFSFPFMQRAIAGGILLGILGGILGGFVVLRRLSVFGHALGHAAFLGVVLAALLQLPPTASLMGFLIVVGLGVIYLIEQTNLSGDIVLSIVVAGALALATILFNFLQGYRGNLLSVLFGDILAISNTDLMLLGVLLAVTVGGLILTLPQQILLTFNPELAKIKGISVLGNRYGFIIILSVAIALAIRSVGILLVNAFLVIPAATAKLICDRFLPFLITAGVLGAISGVAGMVLSGLFNLPSGPSIVLVQLGIFLAGTLFGRRG